MTVAYDFDGVLAEAPPESAKAWRRMKGPERLERRAFLARWYLTAKGLYKPTEYGFHVITARSAWAKETSLDWLMARFGDRMIGLHMLEGARNLENVVKFKARVLVEFGVTDYSEDNRAVVTALRKAVPTCRVWHYKGGRMNLDYPEAPL